ncbi:MAG: hypothetical protein PHN78_06770 [Dehalococcoidales bacterium]|nr:hypothetical protein [Dehalococcoidales bacterium]
MVEMKERIWIEVPWIQLVPQQRTAPTKGKPEFTTICDLKLGETLTIFGWYLHSNPEKQGPGNSWFGQNSAMASCRFLDVPLCHKKNGGYEDGFDERQLLGNRIAAAIREYCTEVNPEIVRAYMEGTTNEVVLDQFSPPSWDGLNLAIPTDFIRIHHVGREYRERGYSSVELGGHLVFWDECIYDPNKEPSIGLRSSSIHDQQVVDLVNAILTASEYAKMLERDCATFGRVRNNVYVAAIAEVDIDRRSPPPIEFR